MCLPPPPRPPPPPPPPQTPPPPPTPITRTRPHTHIAQRTSAMNKTALLVLLSASAAAAFAPSPFGGSAASRAASPTGLSMAVTTAQIKELRDATGAGMMDCKKALIETDGDVEAANDFLRKTGVVKAEKKSSRVAAEGKIAAATKDGKAVMVEVNCETDFVAKDGSFLAFTETVAEAALGVGDGDIEGLLAADASGSTVEEGAKALVAKIGENIQVRRVSAVGDGDTTVGTYVHMGRIGVTVEMEGGSSELCTDVAMHVAAMNPAFATKDDVPADELEKEREVLTAQVAESGKPPEIIEKMVEGRLRKYLEEICLVSQTYVKTNDKTVGELLEQNDAKMIGFKRIEVGEGIEKVEEDYAAEVAKLAAGN